MPERTRREIMIVAGEASGDMHGAALVRELRARRPESAISGMGGRELAAAGVELLADAARLAVVGVVEVIGRLPDILRARRALIRRMKERRPALLILIDFPDFNLWLARAAQKLGIPILYYISPQIWAWRKRRVHAIGRLADRVAVILPFEAELYTRHGYRAVFVGHPLLDRVRPELDAAAFREKYGLAPEAQLVGILPGSRGNEIRNLLPIFLETAARIQASEPDRRRVFLIPRASTVSRELLEANGLAAYRDRLDLRLIEADRYSLMAACRAVLAASGTVTLELALLGAPTVAAYRLTRHTYLLGKLIIRELAFFTLPNLILNRAVIPELLQDAATPENLSARLRPLLEDGETRREMLAGLAAVRERLGEPGAAGRTAELALQIMAEDASRRPGF